MDSKIIFEYGESMCNEDITVWKDTDGYYSIDLEEYIYYEKLEDAIEYYKLLNKKYMEFLSQNYNINKLKKESILINSSQIFYSCHIQILKHEYGYVILTEAPQFDNLYDTYEWLNRAIKQLEGVAA